MVSAVEGATAKQGIAANLAVGLDTLSNDDEVTFTQYVRLVLPLDGFVFWIKTDLVTESALLNAMQFNTAEMNATLNAVKAMPTFIVKGSFHYSTQQKQDEAEVEANNTVIFSAESPIQQFNDINPNILWIGQYGGDLEGFDGPIKFAFSSRGRYYQTADVFHYSGIAVLPAFEAQLIDSADDLLNREPFVSNSLPIWLSLSNYTPPYNNGISNSLALYPSFLIPDNLPPPYGAVHIFPEETISFQAAPIFGPTLQQEALCRDRVRVTLYGLNNSDAMTFLAAVLQFSYDGNAIGMMNMPAIRDEKRTAPELNVIAQKKTIEFEVSYYQNVARDIARQMISSVLILKPSRGVNTEVPIGGEPVIALDTGGYVINPQSAQEALFVDPTGPAADKSTATTVAIQPGQRFNQIGNSVLPLWVNAKTSGHSFISVAYVEQPSTGLVINFFPQPL